MNATVKKNISIVVAIIAVVVGVMAISRSLAYFTSEKNHESNYEVAVIDTHIEEEFEKVTEDEYIKTPRILNQGKSDAIVRARVEVSNSTQKNNIEFIDEDEISNWIYNEDDGYYYYQDVLPVDKETDTLFDKVKIKDTNIMEDFEIIVYSEAIQTVAYDDNGNEISALVDGEYNQGAAMKLWKYYK